MFEQHTFGDFLRWVMLERGGDMTEPKRLHCPVRVAEDGTAQLRDALDEPYTVTWIGHSSLLVRLGGLTMLMDPVWSERVSPVPWAGPKRHTPPGIALDALPPVDVVLLSHNHYDHLDLPTLRALGNGPGFLVPRGVGALLKRNGIVPVREFDWWEMARVGNVTLTCLPAQHFSSRSLFDRNRTLWASWSAGAGGRSFYFGGDSGYFSGFAEIGERLGPFDVAALPIGAYLPRWFMGPIHMGPDEALRAAADLKARIMIPIHWGTFNLAADPHDHAPAVLDNLLRAREPDGSRVVFLMPGDTFVAGD